MSRAEDAFAAQLPSGAIAQAIREYRFDPGGRRWRFDFAWPGLKVAVEIEGGTFIAGRHTRGAAFEADCEKYAEAMIQGWMVLRVTPRMVNDGRALTLLSRVMWIRAAE